MEQHLIQMFRNRASVYGKRTVMRFRSHGDESYTDIHWDELETAVSEIAQSLLALGFGNGSNIGIFSDNRPQWTMADLGILSIRGVVVPFFSTASLSQVEYIVNETGMELMFVGNQEQLSKALRLKEQSSCLRIIVGMNEQIDPQGISGCYSWSGFLELGRNSGNREKLTGIIESGQPGDLATIIYTSGTTGEPKGVMLSHDNFMFCMEIHDQRLNISSSDVSLCFLPLSHVFERAWTFYMLNRGAVNVYLENPKKVIEELKLARPTVMCTVPRFFEKTYEGIRAELNKWSPLKQKIFNRAIAVGQQLSTLKSRNMPVPVGLRLKHQLAEKLVLIKLRAIFGGNIRTMPCSGAAIRTELLRFFHAAGLFVNYGYGASETTATVSCFRSDVYEFESCGTIMPGIEVKLSESGEILVKGRTVFTGYYRKPQETEKVLKDGWYHSGDKGAFTRAGNLVMEDRMNDIFKTSVGKFVSPQKIELLLGNDPYIGQVVAIGDNRKFISALIVPSFQSLLDNPELGLPKDATNQEIVSNSAVVSFIGNRLEQLQQELTPYERVVRFTLLPEAFTIENEILTSTLKLRRKVIAIKYLESIEKMYSAG